MMEYTLIFTAQQLQTIDSALQQIPFYMAAPLIENINKQIKNQSEIEENEK